MTKRLWLFGLLAIVVLAAALRLHGIRDPIVDHPGWRQGDTAGIARNFARLQFDPMYPQTMYNGPPPNYVELELQIVPFLAATLYKVFGVHVIFGRLIVLLFSLGTIVTLAYFARWLFGEAPAGLIASFFYAVFPGSIYYGRTFMPDTAMVFFLTAALFATARYLAGGERLAPQRLAYATALLTLAYLAKPVAVAGARTGRCVNRCALSRAPADARLAYRHTPCASAARSVDLRSPRRVVRGVALGQWNHATARIAGVARRFHRRGGLSR